jgi:hypothetical protein
VCNTGGARRTWLRGIEDVQKRYLVTLAGRNLTVLMRALFGIGTPRSLQGLQAVISAALCALGLAISNLSSAARHALRLSVDHSRQRLRHALHWLMSDQIRPSSPDC